MVSKIGPIVGVVFGVILISILVTTHFQQSQMMDAQIQQTKLELSTTYANLVSDCTTTQSIQELTSCKTTLSDLQTKCKDPNYSSMDVCTDPRVGQFFTTVDSKINSAQTQLAVDGQNISDSILKTVDLCYGTNDTTILSQCQTEMTQIKMDCNTLKVSACSDPRIDQIINRVVGQPSGGVVGQSNQIVSDFLTSCLKQTDPKLIQGCIDTAKNIVELCNSMSSGTPSECSDPRLNQVANLKQSP